MMPATDCQHTTRQLIRRVQIHFELLIPGSCDKFLAYKGLKHDLQDSYNGCLGFGSIFVALERRNGLEMPGFTSGPESSTGNLSSDPRQLQGPPVS